MSNVPMALWGATALYIAVMPLGTTAWAQASSSAVSAPETSGSRTYTVQAAQTQLAVLVKYDRNGLIAGHDHVIQSNQPTGTIVWDPKDMSKCQVSISFPAHSLQVDPGDSRARFGFKGTTSEADKAKIRKNMLGPAQLNAEQFPTISYQADTCEQTAGQTIVHGSLTLHGVKKPVQTGLEIAIQDGRFTAKGQIALKALKRGLTGFF